MWSIEDAREGEPHEVQSENVTVMGSVHPNGVVGLCYINDMVRIINYSQMLYT